MRIRGEVKVNKLLCELEIRKLPIRRWEGSIRQDLRGHIQSPTCGSIEVGKQLC
jgi:hypothetical protein